MKEYILLLSEYWDCYFKNNISLSTTTLKNKEYNKYVFIRGLDTITHIFVYTLLQTKENGFENAYTNAEKGIYYYIEFISQMKEHRQMNLFLTTREAVLYVYKKTIYSMKPNHDDNKQENHENQMNQKKMYDDLNKYYELILEMYLKEISLSKKNVVERLTVGRG